MFTIQFLHVFASGNYVGSKKSDVYHYPSCHYVDQIKHENLIYFSSPEEAIAAGYRPCKGCKPPTSSGKESSSISCLASPLNIDFGDSITIEGSITPSRYVETITVKYTMPNGTYIERTVTSSFDGSYSDTFTPLISGEWNVESSWEGDSIYYGATSVSKSFTVQIIKTHSTVSCELTSLDFILGDSIIVTGSITPAVSAATVNLEYFSARALNLYWHSPQFKHYLLSKKKENVLNVIEKNEDY
jgi:hypothetical protein